MATLAPKGTYVFLDDAAVWLDYSSGRLHITSNDKDLPDGININIRPGTQTDAHLRALLERYSIPLTLEGRDERRRNVDHSQHDHLATPEARAACRAKAGIESVTSFTRLPPTAQPRRSVHHHNTVTWTLFYPADDSAQVADVIRGTANWSGREIEFRMGEEYCVKAELTYGPVWGGYLADLKRLFGKMNVQPTGISSAKRTCETDCTHHSHGKS